MATVRFEITDQYNPQGTLAGCEVEAHSSDVNDGGSLANVVCIYLGEKWDEIVASARGHALTAYAAELKRRDEAGEAAVQSRVQ